MVVKHRRNRRRGKRTAPEAATRSSQCLSCEADLDRENLSTTTSEINSDETSSAQSEGAPILDLASILGMTTPVRTSQPPRSPRSYKKYLQSRGSEVLQLTRSLKKTGDTCSTRSVSPTNTPTSSCGMHVSSPSLSDCSQPGQIQAMPLVHPGRSSFASDACQKQPLIHHCASQQFYASNQQYSLQMVCEPSSFMGHNMPVVSQQALARAVTMPNLWSMCDLGSHLLIGTRTERSDRDLMAIAMPDAFSLSNAEIVSQLQSATPSMYED